MSKRLKDIYIIEDDEMLRDTIANQLEDFFPDLDIVGARGTSHKALIECWEREPDLAIFDIGFPDIYGLEIVHFFIYSLILVIKIDRLLIMVNIGNFNG